MAKKKVVNESQTDLFKKKKESPKKGRVDTTVPSGPVVKDKIYNGIDAYGLMAEFIAAVDGLGVNIVHETHLGILRVETTNFVSKSHAIDILKALDRVVDTRDTGAHISISIRRDLDRTLGNFMLSVSLPAPVEIDFSNS